jgi:cytochrome c peroxidase
VLLQKPVRSKIVISLILLGSIIVSLSSSFTSNSKFYTRLYKGNINTLQDELNNLKNLISRSDLANSEHKKNLADAINNTRLKMKACDFWLRYLEPVAYKKINGPLPVEWETEVFEKFEAPYKREGAGLTLAYQYLEEENASTDSLQKLVTASTTSLKTFLADSITSQLDSYHHFFLCNRLFLLDLATIYTSGFDCPDTTVIIPELLNMMEQTAFICNTYNQEFQQHPLGENYLTLYNNAIKFVQDQNKGYEQFDHFRFIKDYINPLFRINQQHIKKYQVQSSSYMDYSLDDEALSIFDKNLYRAQNTKGVFSRIIDKKILAEIDSIGKLLFYDPILSGDNKRSCASCHKLDNYLADTSLAAALKFNTTEPLERNQPTLINAVYNHLLNLDGKFLTLQDQARGVITNPDEMGSNEADVVKKVLSVPLYKESLTRFSHLSNNKEAVSIKQITSALTFFYGKFSNYYSRFDEAMNNDLPLDDDAKAGFNVFMGKAQCGTCHFAPQFNGIKPPYINNEFEVIGVPSAKSATLISNDNGRFAVHAAMETKHAFRTPTIRNTQFTKPYMHNGIYKTMEEVIDFYDAGGGAGKGITVSNQTLASDSLKLTAAEKKQLIAFIHSLSENIPFETPPQKLPLSKSSTLNLRKAGGEY